jgi:hypothetical protein
MRGREESTIRLLPCARYFAIGVFNVLYESSVRQFDLPTLLNIYDKEAPERTVRLAPDPHRIACLAGLIEQVLFVRRATLSLVCRIVGWRRQAAPNIEQQFYAKQFGKFEK